MSDCKLIYSNMERAVNAIETESKGFDDAVEQYVDESVQADPNHPRFASSPLQRMIVRLSNLVDVKNKTKREEKINKLLGELSEREALALRIRTLIEASGNLAVPIVEELHADAVDIGAGLGKKIFETNPDTGKKKLLLYKLPIATLRKHLRFVEGWINSDPSKWDSMHYKAIRLPFGTTRKIRFTENSGAYHKVWKATQDFADNIASHIDKFMNKRRMHTLLNEVEGLYEKIDSDLRDRWAAQGFYGAKSDTIGKQRIMELFTWMMHGRIEYVDEKRAQKKTKEKPGRPSRLVYEHGAGWYINTWWAPTSRKHENGDVIFGWQKPMPLRYDHMVHGTKENPLIKDHKGRVRHDTLDFIMNMPPVSSEVMIELSEKVQKAREVMDEAFQHFQSETEQSFINVLNSLLLHFPGKTVAQLREAIVDGQFYDSMGREVFNAEDRAKLEFLEENFTKWSLENPFKPSIGLAQYKQFYYPYIYMPEEFVVLIEDAIDSLEYSLDQVQDSQAAATGKELRTLEQKEDAIRQSIENQKEMKEALLGIDADITDGDKMVTRSKSKHFKHISNAFDIFKSRTDRGVFRSYLEHMSRSVERNNLTASLITALSMTDQKGVQDAFLSLYKATMGRQDARSLFLGMDISDENMNPRLARGAKAVRKFWNLMLAGPMTAFKQYFGTFEKINKAGWARTKEATQYFNNNKDALKDILDESGVTLFNEFFTNSIVRELEAMEASRDVINKMVHTYLKYFNKRNKGRSQEVALTELHKELTELWGVPLKWDAILNKAEAKAFNKKLKAEKIQRITNKITNYAINNEAPLRELVKKDPALLKIAGKGVDLVRHVRESMDRFAIMGKMEQYIRSISFILGVKSAQAVGLISSGDIWLLTGEDRRLAIMYGRRATNLKFDFSMSKQGVGEIYRSAAGGLLGQFSVWKTQKFASDLDLWKNAINTMSSEHVPVRILQLLKEWGKSLGKSDEILARTNPDLLNLKRWLRTQFVIEGVIQALYVLPIMPDIVRSIAYSMGARHLGGAGSPLAAMIWAPIMILLSAMMSDDEDPWDDAKDIEKFVAYHIRALPGVGTGIGFGYDVMTLFILTLLQEEEAALYKAGGMFNFLFAEPVTREMIVKPAVKTAVKLAN